MWIPLPMHATNPNELKASLAPTGVLRVAINLGNPILAYRDSAGQPQGISVDLAHLLGQTLGTPVSCKAVDTASQSVAALESGQVDVGFFAVDPKRGEHIAFTSPYVLIEGYYMVERHSPILTHEDVDKPGHTIVVGQGSAYDLFLSRHIQHAELIRAESSKAVVSLFMAGNYSVAAGVKQQLEVDSQPYAGQLRLLDNRFMVIEQAMGIAKSRGLQAAQALRAFIEKTKASDFIDQSMIKHSVLGAQRAPLVDPLLDPLQR